MKKDNTNFLGHRKRLKEKFLRTEGIGLSNYEILELMLFYVVPRRDTKVLAKKIIKEFGSIYNITIASIDKLLESRYLTKDRVIFLYASIEFMKRAYYEKVISSFYPKNFKDIIRFCYAKFASLEKEQCGVIFMKTNGEVIDFSIMSEGTIDSVALYTREIIKKALRLDSKSIILIHNHPSNNTQPSKQDIQITYEINRVCTFLNINLQDHIIIGLKKHFSFKQNNMF